MQPPELYRHKLENQWCIQSSLHVQGTGSEISSANFGGVETWYPTTVPTTILAALVKNDVYPDPYFGKNLFKIPQEPFLCSWWYRNEFVLPSDVTSKHVCLYFYGINQRAHIWFNGNQLAGDDIVCGAFRRFELDITRLIKPGKNVIAVEVFPPKPEDFSIGFVDWNPMPPDRCMGLWREVGLRITKAVSIQHPWVQSKIDLPGMEHADLNIHANLVNHSDASISGVLVGAIDNSIRFEQPITLAPGEQRDIVLTPEHFPDLHVKNPRLWWPHTLGEPHLYPLQLQFLINDTVSDQQSIHFGIREITDYFNEEKLRGLKINGKPLLIRGAGWTDDMMLSDSPERVENQIRYARHMNLNAIRFEGFWGNSDDVYDLCDRYGLLFMAGWSCHWEWYCYTPGQKRPNENSIIIPPKEQEIIIRSFRDQVLALRHHAGLAGWMIASDLPPEPEFERRHREIINQGDANRLVFLCIAKCESSVSGPSGFAQYGPYQYEPPIYWYESSAKGFNWEVCAGPVPPPLESLRRMLPPEHYWPIDDWWNFHCSHSGGGDFNNLNVYNNALQKRYGYRGTVEDYARQAQVMNYELMRAMFEAFACNQPTATGVIQWMFNAAWPKLYWQLFDYYLMPTGAFYAARKACEPLHLAYHYGKRAIYIVNDHRNSMEGLVADIRILSLDATVRYQQTLALKVPANAAMPIHELPVVENLTTAYFLDLRLRKANGEEIGNNFYWLSTKPEIMDPGATINTAGFQWGHGSTREYADFTPLQSLPFTALKAVAQRCSGSHGGEIAVRLENTGETIAFFVEMALMDDQGRASILPVHWSDNYISLCPGEVRTLHVQWNDNAQGARTPHLKVSGNNVAPEIIRIAG